jgi:5-methylcytosine-specific restriction endonuclease McrA
MRRAKKKRPVPRKSTEKPFCNGLWTVAKKNAFIKGLLRAGHLRWAPKFNCINACYIGDGPNPATGRKCKLHKCPECKGVFAKGDMKSDHINPVIPVTGFTTWDDCVERMFIEQDGYSACCVTCHAKKTKQENEERKEFKKNKV